MITGGVPKYVELLVDQNVLSHTEMIDHVFRPNSVFLDEGKLMLKAQALSRSFNGYNQEFRGYSLDDILKE